MLARLIVLSHLLLSASLLCAADDIETTNLSGQHPDVVKPQAAKWEAGVESCRAVR